MNIYRLLPHFILVILAERKLRRLQNEIDTTYDSLIDKSYFEIGRKESK
tara:strand:- start:607 stop:753 length:147 start_codon:yes stop_codon:yes gene_type:complete